ncbi:MAG TPA: insulinase family protein [Candidatus Krumholzibacteria bacterium]|nr:insulinase family protein [Candidatus Krumholzibacteria bacterium]HPD70390.1 insulinase family protein [Candidatus Krumholzibacteria bacterium]HRY39910.1 insulinase family protein [Candidatus Krumholzibacteria bacterium]
MPQRIRRASLLGVLGLIAACGSTRVDAPASFAPAKAAVAGQPAAAPILAGRIDLGDPIPVDPGVRIGTLANGLTYYVRENRMPEQRASLFLVVGAGSVDEDDDQKGLAHMSEHMAFNGTEHFPRQALIDYVESVGMAFGPEVNAFTSLDQTVYMLQVPTDDPELLDTGLRILEDWSHRVTFESGEIDKERGVITEEWRSGLGADERIYNQQMPVLFHGSKYAERHTIGDMDIVASFPHDTIRRFYRDWYRPDLQAVVAVGDFAADSLITRIEALFGDNPAPHHPRPREDPPVPGHAGTLFSVVTDPEATRTTVELMWQSEPRPVETVAEWCELLALDLGTAMLRSRFDELSQAADPPFSFAMADYGQQVRTMSAFTILAMTAENKVARAVEVVAREVERLRRHGFTAGELARARADLLRSLESRTEEAAKTESRRWCFQYMQHFLYGEPIPGPANQLQLARQLLPGITLDEVAAAVTGLVTDGDQVVLVSGPRKDGLAWPDESALAGILASAATAEVEPYEDAALDAPLVAAIPAAVEITAREVDAELGTTTWTLTNGVTVVLKPTAFKNDEVLLAATAWGGTSRIAGVEQLRRIASAADIVAASGVGAFGPVELDKKLAGMVVSCQPQISAYEEGFRGRASPRDLETLCQLVYLYATEPREDPAAFASWQDRLRTWLRNRDADPVNALRDTVEARASSRDPRSRPVTLAEVDAMDLAGSLAFYREVFADCSDLVFVLVGAVDPVAFEPIARTWLGNLPGGGRADRWTDRTTALPDRVLTDTLTRGLDPKGVVQMVFQGEDAWSPEQEYAFESTVAALRIRLREVVREEMSGTYGVRLRGRYVPVPRPRYRLDLGWGCDPARVEELTAAVWQVIEDFRANGPDADTLAKVRETQLREDETSLQDNRYWLRQLAEHRQRGLDPHRILRRAEDVATLSGDLVRDTVRRCLDPQRYVKVVLLPERASTER